MIDLLLTDGDVVIQQKDLSLVSGDAATRQRLEQKLRLWQGEWFLDRAAGFPWLQEILGQRPRIQLVSALLRDLVARDPGVTELVELTADYSSEAGRELQVTFRARLAGSDAVETVEVAL